MIFDRATIGLVGMLGVASVDDCVGHWGGGLMGLRFLVYIMPGSLELEEVRRRGEEV